ncbi:MAG: cupin domain-containing protein [bacterium]|nr:cupin domain-containing protein [bacterium]
MAGGRERGLMEIRHYTEVLLEEAEAGSRGLKVRWVLGPRTGPKRCYMRIFELQPGGNSPRHEHPGEHAVYVLQGSGLAVGAAGETPISAGTCIHIPGGQRHQLKNNGSETLIFLCVLSAPD